MREYFYNHMMGVACDALQDSQAYGLGPLRKEQFEIVARNAEACARAYGRRMYDDKGNRRVKGCVAFAVMVKRHFEEVKKYTSELDWEPVQI